MNDTEFKRNSLDNSKNYSDNRKLEYSKEDYFKSKTKASDQDSVYSRKRNSKKSDIKRGVKNTSDDIYRRGSKSLLKNTDGGDELIESIRHGLEAPIKSGFKIYKTTKEFKDFKRRRQFNSTTKKQLKEELKAAKSKYQFTRKEFRTLKRAAKREYKSLSQAKGKKGLPFNAKGIMEARVKAFTRGSIFNSSSNTSNEYQLGLSGLSFAKSLFGRATSLIWRMISFKIKKFLIIGGALLLLMAVIGMSVPTIIIGSPFGVLFGMYDNNNFTAGSLLRSSFDSFNSKIQSINAKHQGADAGIISYDMKSGKQSNFNDIIAVYAVKYSKNGELVSGELDTNQKQNLSFLFQKGVSYDSKIETVSESGTTKKVLHTTVHMKTWSELCDIYNFTQEERNMVKEIVESLGDSDADLKPPVKYEGEGTYNDANASVLQKLIAYNAANGISDQAPIYGWCAAWVRGVYAKAGVYWGGAPDAGYYWDTWGYTGSTSMDNIPLGAACILSRTSANGGYGHIGIYIGNGMIASNLGYVKIETVQSYATSNGASWVGWCWPGGNVLANPQ